jgi:hypothetical protein
MKSPGPLGPGLFILRGCGDWNCTSVWRFSESLRLRKGWTIPRSTRDPSIIVSEPSQLSLGLAADCRITMLFDHHAHSFESRCGAPSLTGFQQFRKFFLCALPRRVTHAYEPPEVLLLYPAMCTVTPYHRA